MLDPNILGYEHYSTARAVQECLQSYKDLRDIIAILGMEELEEKDKLTVTRARKIQRFLSQPFHVAEPFTNKPGRLVALKDTIKGFREILDGKYDTLPEQAFYMVGNITEVLSKAEEIAKEAARYQETQKDQKKEGKKEEKKEEKKESYQGFRIVYLKEKIPLDQYIRDESPKAVTKLTDLAKKAEEMDLKKAEYIQKIKGRLHPSQMKFYMTPDQVKSKWQKWNSENQKDSSDPIAYVKKLANDVWTAEKSDREAKMRT
jgi:hypothetical protein